MCAAVNRVLSEDLTRLGSQVGVEWSGYDVVEPFFMSIVSDCDLWLYLSSLGSLTAGRVDCNQSLFLYSTEDTIHRSAGKTGPITIIRVPKSDGTFEFWEPFQSIPAGEGITRKIFKSVLNNFLVFEENNSKLGVTFRYRWTATDKYGWVRTAQLINEGEKEISFEVVDGLLELLPCGVSANFAANSGVLVDAYTSCEVVPSSGLTTFALSSLIIDRAEPGEALRANVAWSRGLDDSKIFLHPSQFLDFKLGKSVAAQTSLKGRRASFLQCAQVTLTPGQMKSWDLVIDANLSQAQVVSLNEQLLKNEDIRLDLRDQMDGAADRLETYVAAADGQNLTSDKQADGHQAASVLFNVMRGGIYPYADKLQADDFRAFVNIRNRQVSEKHQGWLEKLQDGMPYRQLLESAEYTGDASLARIATEYLPLSFSRRHGDPSRPWNYFAIHLKNPDGSPLLSYQGNWRDIFQNWEALSLSYPVFLESIIAKFVNASTVDGFNGYRITREGIDWEVPEPDNPWSGYGYWGDHQIVYLLKLLELANEVDPDALAGSLAKRQYSYANVPMRLKSYAAMVKDPHDTIIFDHSLNGKIETEVSELGSDAKLVLDNNGEVHHATLAEKLIVPVLSKLSNLVLDAGIWMNTQRPEWNDANNALVGNGISMVTLCYLRRFLAFCKPLFESHSGEFVCDVEVAEWLRSVVAILYRHQAELDAPKVSPELVRNLLDELETSFEGYRNKVYATGFRSTTSVPTSEVVALCDIALPYLDHSIRASKRSDGLYHSYNILDLRVEGRATVSHMYEMLEGQVAVISSGLLDPNEVISLVEALYESKIFREDQSTFMLYPERILPTFLEKNKVPASVVELNPLLSVLIESGNTQIVLKDAAGGYRFAPNLRNAGVLAEMLDTISADSKFSRLVEEHRAETLSSYESVFGHRSFTGRSGSMYGYEGLGSIYWHMNSKLLVAVEETLLAAVERGDSQETIAKLKSAYYRIREGMGFRKSPNTFGAFPTDPYSHTPAGRGAKQPGMTGQTKEDILARWMELGVLYRGGKFVFRPSLLKKDAFLTETTSWLVRDFFGNSQDVDLDAGTLGFTICGVPVIYQLSEGNGTVELNLANGQTQMIDGLSVPEELSQKIYLRTGEVTSISVCIPEGLIAE